MIYLYLPTSTCFVLIAHPKVPQSKHSFLWCMYLAFFGSFGMSSMLSSDICKAWLEWIGLCERLPVARGA